MSIQIQTDEMQIALVGSQLRRLAEQFAPYTRVKVDILEAFTSSILDAMDVVILEAGIIPSDAWPQLEDYVSTGGICLVVGRDVPVELPEWFGVSAYVTGPQIELRVLFTDHEHPARIRISEAYYMNLYRQQVEVKSETVETHLYADWRYSHIPVWTANQHQAGTAIYTWLADFENPDVARLYHRLLLTETGRHNTQTLGVGLLGYSPAVGQLHGQGSALTSGLALRAVCDLNSERLTAAEAAFPEITLYPDAAQMAADPTVDIVIVTTPPNSHTNLSVQMLDAGKHVVCEKPLAFTRAQVEEMRTAAQQNDRLLACHQNRRWDVDYLAIKQALGNGLIGEVFYMETFVGSFNHPCGYWHSEESVSGGTTYDWGAHYFDWILDLIDEPVIQVMCTRHKRVWHDVTNADQERIQLRFANGQEAEFIHSDVAAVRKPKWYLLGTEGAIVGDWQDVTSYDIDPILYFHRTDIPSTEMPPKLTAMVRSESGDMIEQKLTLPEREDYGFHRNLADHLLLGEPLTVPVEHTARVVSVLEAASKSGANGGKPEMLYV